MPLFPVHSDRVLGEKAPALPEAYGDNQSDWKLMLLQRPAVSKELLSESEWVGQVITLTTRKKRTSGPGTLSRDPVNPVLQSYILLMHRCHSLLTFYGRLHLCIWQIPLLVNLGIASMTLAFATGWATGTIRNRDCMKRLTDYVMHTHTVHRLSIDVLIIILYKPNHHANLFFIWFPI